MPRATLARATFGLTALTVLVGLIVQIGVSVNAAPEDSYFQGSAARRRITWRDVGLATIIPIAWCVFTLFRGPIVDFYPYPFVDVRVHGYAVVLVNIALVALLFVTLAAIARGADGWLARRGLDAGDVEPAT